MSDLSALPPFPDLSVTSVTEKACYSCAKPITVQLLWSKLFGSVPDTDQAHCVQCRQCAEHVCLKCIDLLTDKCKRCLHSDRLKEIADIAYPHAYATEKQVRVALERVADIAIEAGDARYVSVQELDAIHIALAGLPIRLREIASDIAALSTTTDSNAIALRLIASCLVGNAAAVDRTLGQHCE